MKHIPCAQSENIPYLISHFSRISSVLAGINYQPFSDSTYVHIPSLRILNYRELIGEFPYVSFPPLPPRPPPQIRLVVRREREWKWPIRVHR